MNSMSRLGKNDNLHVRPGLEPTVRQESEIKGNIFTQGDPNNFSQIAASHSCCWIMGVKHLQVALAAKNYYYCIFHTIKLHEY